jgi:hypothetical protein
VRQPAAARHARQVGNCSFSHFSIYAFFVDGIAFTCERFGLAEFVELGSTDLVHDAVTSTLHQGVALQHLQLANCFVLSPSLPSRSYAAREISAADVLFVNAFVLEPDHQVSVRLSAAFGVRDLFRLFCSVLALRSSPCLLSRYSPSFTELLPSRCLPRSVQLFCY